RLDGDRQDFVRRFPGAVPGFAGHALHARPLDVERLHRRVRAAPLQAGAVRAVAPGAGSVPRRRRSSAQVRVGSKWEPVQARAVTRTSCASTSMLLKPAATPRSRTDSVPAPTA